MISGASKYIKSQKGPIVAGLFLAPLLLAAVHWRPQVLDTWRKATTRSPEPFSELYFAAPHALPKQLVAGQATSLDFVIANHEAAQHHYHYQVVVIKQGRSTPQLAGEVTLPNGQSATRQVTIPPQQQGEHLQVEIRLPDKNQYIRFSAEVAS